jgi:hypothetical protein
MDEEEKPLYYGIILACIVGIAITSLLLLQTTPSQEEFSELYFYFERIDLTDGKGIFNGCTIIVSDTIWIDTNVNTVRDQGEIFVPGDTFVLNSEFWNISDVAKDWSQILMGKFPKKVHAGDINFSFVIVNHLLQDHDYTYAVTVNGTSQENTIFVKKGEKKLIFQTLSVDTGEFKVAVTLDTGEDIYFYLTVEE